MKQYLMSLLFFVSAIPAVWAVKHSSGSDSCGLGWAVTKEKTLSATSTRGTTNGFLPPTLGMTSGTIGCDYHSIAQKDLPAVRYVDTNFDLLKYEMAMGDGEHLLALARIMNYTDERCFMELVQSRYAQIVPGQTSVQVFKTVQSMANKQCASAATMTI